MHVRNSSQRTNARRTQEERRASSRAAILESAARALSRNGYAKLNLEQVARDAGYTRGALYHQFRDKEDLALAVVRWVDEDWQREVGALVAHETDPVKTLLTLARGHAVYCRRDVARFAAALRIEFAGQDHPVGRELARITGGLVKRVTKLIDAARANGAIPKEGPPSKTLAKACMGALEGAVIELRGEAPHDELLAARAVAGVLGIAREASG